MAKPPRISINGEVRLATRAILLASRSTAATLASKRCAQDILEREGLDDADALQRLLQRLQDADPAGELRLGDAANALDHLAQNQHRGREHDERS